INNLKQANDTMGHSAGDELICTAAECILSVFDSLGCCYRMGGDEFVVLLQNITESQVNKALSELELCISRRNLTRPFPLSLAMGYAMGQDAPIEQMFREADAAMYRNKSRMKCHAIEP
ncbi:MAG TPA: GGDEF domain-containing protein, partial [Candidatus Agathobaculum merdavium]|nr:GGDEF domain-containing protein [Candidatus Agathobaculum merdavium]